jgi:hypothetical protein
VSSIVCLWSSYFSFWCCVIFVNCSSIVPVSYRNQISNK